MKFKIDKIIQLKKEARLRGEKKYCGYFFTDEVEKQICEIHGKDIKLLIDKNY